MKVRITDHNTFWHAPQLLPYNTSPRLIHRLALLLKKKHFVNTQHLKESEMGTTMSGNQGRKRQRISSPEQSEALKEPSTTEQNKLTTVTITEETRDASNDETVVSLLNEHEKLIKQTTRLESSVKALRCFMSNLTAMSGERQGGVCDDTECIHRVTLYNAADNAFSDEGLHEGALSSLCGRIQAKKLTNALSRDENFDLERVSKLKQLEELRIEYPRGKPVNMISLKRLHMLKMLYLKSNNVDNNGARHLFNIGTLEELVIADTMQLANIRGISRLTNLKCLELNSTDIDDSCVRRICACVKLFKLSVSECNNIMDATPISQLAALEELNLNSCYHITKGIGTLGMLLRLRVLDLSGAPVEDNFLKDLCDCGSLERLNLSYCIQLTDINPLSNAAATEELNLNGCRRITRGMGVVWVLPKLRVLHMKDMHLSEPSLDSVGTGGPLVKVSLDNCAGFGDMTLLSSIVTLEELNIQKCVDIISGVGCLGTLPYLVYLTWCGLPWYTTVPRVLNIKEAHISSLDFTGICASKSLLQLNMESITGLSNVEALANILTLEKLSLLGCNGIDAVIGCLGNPPQLKMLDLSGTNTDNESLRSLCLSQTMVSLNLSHCWKMTNMSHISSLEALNELNLSDCFEINAGWEALEKLQQLHVAILSNTHITDGDISHFSKCKNLVTLDLSFCDKLLDVTALSNITTLEDLNLSNCSKIRKGLSVLGELPRLRVLNVKGVLLEDSVIGSLGNGKSFAKLSLENCKGFGDVKPLSNLVTLEELNLHYCDKVTSGMGTLGSLPQLRVLDLGRTQADNNSLENICTSSIPLVLLNLSHCKKITSISTIASLTALEELNIDNCCNVTSGWNVFGTLHQLRVATLSNTRINDENIRYVSECKSLNTLNLAFCKDITDVTALSKITMLEELNLDCCHNIRKGIETLGKLPKARILSMKECYMETDMRNNVPSLGIVSHLNSWKASQGTYPKHEGMLHGDGYAQQCSILGNSKSLVKLNLERSMGFISVKALSNIATLEELVLDHAQEVCCIPSFSCLPRLRVLNLKYTDINGDVTKNISESKSLRSLNLSHCKWVTDISVLSSLSTLEELNISECEQIRKGWESLGKLPLLRVAILSDTKITAKDIVCLSSCKTLVKLKFFRCEELSDVTVVYKIQSLEELIVKNCSDGLKGLNAPGTLPRLRFFASAKCERMLLVHSHGCVFLLLRNVRGSDISVESIGTSKSLVRLTIEVGEDLTDTTPLSDITSLEELSLRECGDNLGGVGTLEKLPRLKSLDLGLSDISNSTLNDICLSRSITSLNLSNNYELTDISHISNLTALEELNLRGCYHITSGWEALSELPRLRVLNLESARVTTRYDGYYISRCKSLVTLNIQLSDMTDASYIANIKTLEELHIGECDELRWGFSALFTLPRLRILDLFMSRITDEDLRNIQPPHTIEELNLSYCENLNDITPLGRIKSIKNLHFLLSYDARRLREEGFRSLLELPCLSWVGVKNAYVSSDILRELRKRRLHIH
ncbi:leucine-rich repeat protein (LRRP, pseudogene),putative [Trypanosoma brucei gambiense DAL972]|uniref:leucine-rich repeat protein (LRRP, pseudogene),putative n=1 Tax=Trypanosoma brucei gambiense (strain MHOM/CI/86/DAL972) TaxID=679716 RepID=UPI0001B9D1D3|nr:LOW QUALITY PROTEIN: leucine-rich repeat protein (LRRP, pseudogene),putative [Trypanosoma brucei gambiense DAL972]CBH14837.1 leucine-rich repeat protein (LRRP, pseudogene),putative [Trypanosoma brucei gambiense DAL972]|eukprot:XP_011777103.1 LOW QUALITY PROTEIN: leucine-rich repeat protein (LRRP, pseudogene),putative [Trypanosoma brucei gambiense DAL972]